MGLWSALQLNMQKHRAVALVGGGGKTTVMYALAQEARAAGRTVIITTTTHIMPHPGIFLTDDARPEALRRSLDQHGILTLGGLGQEDKLCGRGGIEACKACADFVLIEADGARLHPLKAPADHEPVIPPQADAVLAVAGMDAVGRQIGTVCHRPERVCGLLKKKPSDAVTPQDVALLLSSGQGGKKSVLDTMAFRCILNKADLDGCEGMAREIVDRLDLMGITAAITMFKEEERGGLCWF